MAARRNVIIPGAATGAIRTPRMARSMPVPPEEIGDAAVGAASVAF